ncbi:unnamed protein product [Allacma fusca]|uniref:Uncharacterized protein n=1 Tax=Allacma fusca TaxID=39272 RepID=A0A8J2L9X8_9HEXA|nr:unnamed protein product [Allacma fusca]
MDKLSALGRPTPAFHGWMSGGWVGPFHLLREPSLVLKHDQQHSLQHAILLSFPRQSYSSFGLIKLY